MKPRTLRTLLGEVPKDLSGYVQDFNFILSDFSSAGSPEFRGHPLLQALLRVFHAMPAGNLRAELERIMLLWRGLTDEPTGRQLFRAMLEYLQLFSELKSGYSSRWGLNPAPWSAQAAIRCQDQCRVQRVAERTLALRLNRDTS